VRIDWSEEALDDLARLVEFLIAVSPRAAEDVADLLLAAPDRLSLTPRLGQRVERDGPEEVRRIFVSAYELRYLVTPEAVVVLRIWHTRENR
jgi:plasmid stabilization system protein ParE